LAQRFVCAPAIEWRGATRFIERAYRASQSVVHDAFAGAVEETLNRGEEAGAEADGAPGAEREEMAAEQPAEARDEQRNSVIQLVVYRDNYTKVCLLERTELADSFLAGAVEPSAVSRMYVDDETYQRLRERLTIGETLWRELTPAGRREVADRSRSHSEESTD
jgi:hypothetical protein